ncbi:molybdopterin-dependent oxidoreductase [Thiocystis violacea]|uniref:molybdopterin-dependent oxidoreductase n=1 Tax=Thiocystis violacea TaxID=13725 RepID=UPI001904883F|nr:molybdopterin-dependent oxidoreductase [Thiocystis violacea]MBK1723235.1 hypothetical protein [Thiocystis violacea]
MKNLKTDALCVDARGHMSGHGAVHAFPRAFADNAAAQADPAVVALHRRLLDKASVCGFRGVGCPYRVVEAPGGWEEALDRATWSFLHTRKWVGPQPAAIYGNGQKTLEAIWLASLYQLVFGLPTIGANSEHCLASAGSAHERSFGNEASFTWREREEIDQCDVVITHGANPLVTFPQA